MKREGRSVKFSLKIPSRKVLGNKDQVPVFFFLKDFFGEEKQNTNE